MAIWSIADQSGASPTIYRKKWNQTQRKIPTLRLFSQLGVFKRADTPNTCTWGAKFTGQAAGAVNTDGGAFVTAASDQNVATSLVYGSYAAPARITDGMVQRLSVLAGAGPDINAMLAEPVQEAILDAGAAILKLMNQHLYIGLGTSNQMVGAATAIAATGTYANISAANQTAWASQVTANGGALQSLTLNRIRTLLENVSINSNEGRPDLAVCRPPVFSAWSNLFDAYTQVTIPVGMGPALPIRPEKVERQPPAIRLAGGEVKADGFRCMYWPNENLWIMEDPDAVDQGATNTNNTIFLFNTGNLDFLYLPPIGAQPGGAGRRQVTAAEQDMGDLATLPMDLAYRGRIDYAETFDLTATGTIAFRSRNAHAKLQDQQ